MALAFVQAKIGSDEDESGGPGLPSYSITFDNPNTAGNCLIVNAIGTFPVGLPDHPPYTLAPLNIVDHGNTWTRVILIQSPDTGYEGVICSWIANNCIAGANTITITPPPGFVNFDVVTVSIHEYSGIFTAIPVEHTNYDATATMTTASFTFTAHLPTTMSGGLVHFFYASYQSSWGDDPPTTAPAANLRTASNINTSPMASWDTAFSGSGTATVVIVPDNAPTFAAVGLLLALQAGGSSPITVSVNTLTGCFSAVGGVPPYTFTVTSGSVPPGMVLNPTSGCITGTPTTPGTYPFTVTVTDSTSATGSLPVVMTISAASGDGLLICSSICCFEQLGVIGQWNHLQTM